VGLALLLVTLLSLVVYGHMLEPGKTLYSPYSDFIAGGLATKTILYQSIQEGRGIPFWRNDQLSGYQGLTHPLSLYTYPLHVPFLIAPPMTAIGWAQWLQFLAAGVSMYFLGAVLGLRFWPRLLMAAAALMSFKLILATYAGWCLGMVALMPAMMAAVMYLMQRPTLGRALLTALVGALCLHTGHLQLLYYIMLFILAYWLWQWVGWIRRREWKVLGKTTGYLVAAGVLAVGMTSYLLIPMASGAKMISRGEGSYQFLTTHSLESRQLATLFYPEALGSPVDDNYRRNDQIGANELWEDEAYFGLIPLILAVAGAILGWRRPITKYLAICFVVSLIVTADTPILKLLYAGMPGFKLFRCPARFLFLTSFFGMVLAGIGAEEVLARLRARGLNRWIPALVIPLALALMTVEGHYYSNRYLTMVPQKYAMPETSYSRFFAEDRSAFRIAPVGRGTINYGWAAPMGLHVITGYDGVNYRQYQGYFNMLQFNKVLPPRAQLWYDLRFDPCAPQEVPLRPSQGRNNADLLDILNVKYVVSRWPLRLEPGHFKEAAAFEKEQVFGFYQGMALSNIFIYRNEGAAGQAYWAQEAVAASNEDDLAARMRASEDLRRTAVVLCDPQALPAKLTPSAGPAEVEQAYEGYYRVKTDRPVEGYLVISDVWHPGWRARLDGVPVPLYRTNYALMGVRIGPSKHELVLEFRPSHWAAALGVSLASGAAVLLLATLGAIRRVRRVKSNNTKQGSAVSG
jgi:hypothetical protein